MKIRVADLPRYTVEQNSRCEFDVRDDRGRMAFANIDEQTATLIAALPRLLAFIAKFPEDCPQAQAVNSLLRNCNIELEDRRAVYAGYVTSDLLAKQIARAQFE